MKFCKMLINFVKILYQNKLKQLNFNDVALGISPFNFETQIATQLRLLTIFLRTLRIDESIRSCQTIFLIEHLQKENYIQKSKLRPFEIDVNSHTNSHSKTENRDDAEFLPRQPDPCVYYRF